MLFSAFFMPEGGGGGGGGESGGGEEDGEAKEESKPPAKVTIALWQQSLHISLEIRYRLITHPLMTCPLYHSIGWLFQEKGGCWQERA